MRIVRHFWIFGLIVLALGAFTPTLAQQSMIPVVETTGPTSASTCGVSSGNFARICRPGSNKRCLDAVRRGVKGFSRAICIDRREACETCLGRMQRCFKTRIDTSTADTKQTTCKSCTTRYNSCMKRIYPGYAG